MQSPEHFSQPQQDRFAEALSASESPNQPFHDHRHNFAQEFLRDVEQSMNAMGMAACLLDTQITYERENDKLLAERDRQRGGL